MSAEDRQARRGAAGVSVPADRRFRRTDTAIDRRRRSRKTMWRVVRWVVMAAVAAVAVAWMGQGVIGSDALRVRDISVEGNARLSSAEVEQLVPGLRGENILKVDFRQYERRILDSPWVADVTLFRALPAKVKIHVVERVPMAIARIDQTLYLVDQDGVIIDEYAPAHQAFDLPLVDGLVDGKSTDNVTVVPERAQLARRLFSAFDRLPALRQRLSQIDVSSSRDAVVMIDDDSALLHLGADKFAERLQRYLDLRPTLHDRFQRIDYVDLRFDERVYLNGVGLRARAAP
jgi:cell division protein FtsQ